MKTFIHPNLLRCVNFGGNEEAVNRWLEKIVRETADVEFLQKAGLPMHEAWLLVKGWVN
jgi:hypothetical protein